MRFKVDYYDSSWAPFGLYFAQRRWWGVKWKCINHFETLEQARAYYEKIKDMPEYLP